MARNRADSAAIGLAVTTGGAAALSWEILWQLGASLALGVSAQGTAITLAATLAGLAVGSLAAGRALRRRAVARPLWLYAALELAIGVGGLLMPLAFAGVERLDAAVYRAAPGAAPWFHAASIALILGLPTAAMGATLPVFQLVARAHATSVAALYGLNTAGACLGVLLASFVLLPALGVAGTGHAVAAANFVAAGLALLLPAPRRAGSGPEPFAPAKPIASGALALPAAVVFVTGLATFGLEVAWFRALRAAFWSTTDAFAIMLASVLGPLALGAHLARRLRARGVGFALPLAAAGVAILLATPLVERMDLFASARSSHAATLGAWLALSLAMLGPPMALLGIALPWVLEAHPSPRDSGRLYAANTLGAVAGSLAAVWWWLPTLGFARTAWLLGGGVLGLGLLVARGRGRAVAAFAGAAAAAVAVVATSSPGRDRDYQRRDFAQRAVLALEEAPDATVSVVESRDGLRSIVIDGFVASVEGGVGDYVDWMGRLPMLLHPDPRRALVICFGTGQTAWATLDEGPEHLDVVDVSAAVLGMAPWFPSNHGVLEDPRVSPIVMDGRAWLRRTTHRYDVITLEPMPPNFAGVNALYSLEFYRIAAERLTPDGVVAQWLPVHLLSRPDARAVAATFRAAFPDSALWFDADTGTGILLGRAARPGRPPLGSAWPGFARRDVPRPLDEAGVRTALRIDPAQLGRYAERGVPITDDNQRLAFGRDRARDRSLASARERGRRNLRELRAIAEASR